MVFQEYAHGCVTLWVFLYFAVINRELLQLPGPLTIFSSLSEDKDPGMRWGWHKPRNKIWKERKKEGTPDGRTRMPHHSHRMPESTSEEPHVFLQTLQRAPEGRFPSLQWWWYVSCEKEKWIIHSKHLPSHCKKPLYTQRGENNHISCIWKTNVNAYGRKTMYFFQNDWQNLWNTNLNKERGYLWA